MSVNNHKRKKLTTEMMPLVAFNGQNVTNSDNLSNGSDMSLLMSQ